MTAVAPAETRYETALRQVPAEVSLPDLCRSAGDCQRHSDSQRALRCTENPCRGAAVRAGKDQMGQGE